MMKRILTLALLACMVSSAFAQIDRAINFGKVTPVGTYTSASTSVVLTSGHGARLPDPATWGPYYLVWFNATDYADPSDDPNREVVRVTFNSGDLLNISRAQDGTVASNKNTAGKTYRMQFSFLAGNINSMIDTLRSTTAKWSSVHNLGDWDTTGRGNHEIPVWNSSTRKYEHEASPYFNVSANYYGRANSAGDSVINGRFRDSSNVTVFEGQLKFNGYILDTPIGMGISAGNMAVWKAVDSLGYGGKYVDGTTDTVATRSYARSQGGGGSFSGSATKIQGDTITTVGRDTAGGASGYEAVVHNNANNTYVHKKVFTLADTTGAATADPLRNVLAMDSGAVSITQTVPLDTATVKNFKGIIGYEASTSKFLVLGNSGSASFTTTGTRLAIYVPGAASTDIFVVSPAGADAAPSANDVLRCYAKTDSVVVNRLASGTSGLTVNYIRVKP